MISIGPVLPRTTMIPTLGSGPVVMHGRIRVLLGDSEVEAVTCKADPPGEATLLDSAKRWNGACPYCGGVMPTE